LADTCSAAEATMSARELVCSELTAIWLFTVAISCAEPARVWLLPPIRLIVFRRLAVASSS
jgi:hypothetical protein